MKAPLAIIGCALGASLLASAEQDKTTDQKTFSIDRPEAARVEVDNVNGAIRVTGYDGREVEVIAHRTVEADSKEKMEEARRDVRLDMSQEGGKVRLYVDGPFRCKCSDGSMNYRGRRHYGYEVRYDFEIRAPRQASVFLRTVNHGEIRVAGVAGDYDVENINAGVEIEDAAGSGHVYAVNGGVKVTFARNPRADSSFGSLNGAVDLFFQPGLAANLSMKTFNGKVYSDFPATAIPASLVPSTERREGRRVYKADAFTRARVGAGGPEIKLDGFNGDIRILERK